MKTIIKPVLFFLCFELGLIFSTKIVDAQMICCNGCYGGMCQVQANCVFGGQTCSDECLGQGASCGNTCTYNSNCPGYPNESCVSGACVQNTPTPTVIPPTSTAAPIPTATNIPQITTIPTPTNTALSCPYCSSPLDLAINSCNACYVSVSEGYTHPLGKIYVEDTTYRSDTYVYNVYTCYISKSNNNCGIPYVVKDVVYSDYPIQSLQGCWPSGCGPYPPGSNLVATPTPTRTPTPPPSNTPTPTFTPTPTACPNRCTGNICGSFTVGGCTYNCGNNNCSSTQYCQNNACTSYKCNDPCPGNGFNCGGGLWCSGLAGNVCRAPGNPSNTSCIDGTYTSPTPDSCGNNICSAGESCLTCAVDCCPLVTGGVTNTPVPAPSYTFTVAPNPCTMISATECESTITWETTNYPNVTVTTNTGIVGDGPTGKTATRIGTTSCVTYYLKSDGTVITSETLCPQRKWIKLKNASYQSRGNHLVNPIPDTVQPYDSDDTTEAQFIIGDAGSVTARLITPYPTVVSSAAWIKEGYIPRIVMDKDKLISYIRSRKPFQTISSTQLPALQTNTIYVITDPTLTLTNTAPFDGKNVVIIVNGTITFDLSGTFSPLNGHVAFIADTINLSSGNNYLSTINALLIANTVTTGNIDNTGLKITGNLITKSLINERTQSSSSNTKPSLFISVDPQTYLSLLPLISTAKYEWKQLN